MSHPPEPLRHKIYTHPRLERRCHCCLTVLLSLSVSVDMAIVQRIRPGIEDDNSTTSPTKECKVSIVKGAVKAAINAGKERRSRPRQKPQRKPDCPPSTSDPLSTDDSETTASSPATLSPLDAASLVEAQTNLQVMAIVTGIFLFMGIMIPIPWFVFMHEAGFVNLLSWPRLLVDALLLVVPVTIDSAIVVVVSIIDSSICHRYRGGITSALHVVNAVLFAGVLYGFLGTTINRASVFSLQTGPVATYNQAFCQAWCRQREPTMAALARGECGNADTSVFDYAVSFYDVSDWCREAIAKKDYALGATHGGISPFASWNGPRRADLMTPEGVILIFHTMICMLFHLNIYSAVRSFTS